MPWTKADVEKFNKGLSDKQKTQWVAVANSALNKCMTDGGEDCEASAIRQANAAVKRAAKSEAADIVLEIGKMISSANMKTIHTAMAQMTAAMQMISKMVGEGEEDEEEKEAKEAVSSLGQKTVETYLLEASAILAQDESYDSTREKVGNALRKRAAAQAAANRLDGNDDYYYYGGYPYVRDIYDNYVVYSQKDRIYQCEYKIDGDLISLGEPVEVKVSYVPVTMSKSEEEDVPGYANNNLNSDNDGIFAGEAQKVRSGIVPLIEKAVREDGKARIKLISPGWGSSGYYSEEVLKRDGPKVFSKGLHMFINHQTEAEANERPEGDLRDLAGVIDSEVIWENNPQTGPGLYADARVFGGWKEFVDEAAPHIGVSIRAGGKVKEGEAEGKKGWIIEELSEGYSVDYVTLPGRGGAVLPLLESARKRQQITADKNKDNQVDEKEFQAFKEAQDIKLNETTKALEETQTELARMREAMILRDARDIVKETLASMDIPDMTKARLSESLGKNPPVKDGILDVDTLKENIKTAALAEMQYLEAAAGSARQPTGVGTSNNTMSEEDQQKALEEAMKLIGLDENAAKIAAKGR